MLEAGEITAWTSLLFGLFALAAGIGEVRMAGHWQKLLQELNASPALQLLLGFLQLAIGGIIYLANPWGPDWLSCVMSLFGALMVLEALIILAFGEAFISFWLRRFGALARFWALLSIVIGVVLIAVAIPRF